MWWLVLQFGSTATPSRPPSPPVVTTLGTVPISVGEPPAAGSWKSLKVSRSVISIEPSGSQLIPHGTDQPVEIVVIEDGTPPLPEAVVALTWLLGGDVLPAASWATTVSRYV